MPKPKLSAGGRGIGLVGNDRTDLHRLNNGRTRKRIKHELLLPPPPEGMVLSCAPHSAMARDILSPAEHEARIEALALQHAAAEPPPQKIPHCWGCGKPSPNGTRPDVCGWKSRRNPLYAKGSSWEVYCAECFARWGWPSVPGVEQ